MNRSYKIALTAGLLVLVALLAGLFLGRDHIAVLDARGPIAAQERSLMIFTALLGALVVVPVLIMTFTIAWKYRAGNTKATYTPDWDHNPVAETVWWGLPCVIIVVLAVVTWNSSHSLDPFRPIASTARPLTVQVVALPWKWLFIYPEQNMATVNYLKIPAATPIDFVITADAPMNSFWIPQLGGQIYAMAGMSTHLHLMADEPGSFRGSSANLSGRGFAGMKFAVKAVDSNEFNTWINDVKNGHNELDAAAYNKLARPSEDNPVALYRSKEPGLYDKIIAKYMSPSQEAGGIDNSAQTNTREDKYGTDTQ